MSLSLKEYKTLGELIAAVAEEAAALPRTDGNLSLVVSHIVNELFASGRVRLRNGLLLKIS